MRTDIWTLQGGGYLSQTQGVGMEGYMEEKAAPNPGDSHLEDVTQTVIKLVSEKE